MKLKAKLLSILLIASLLAGMVAISVPALPARAAPADAYWVLGGGATADWSDAAGHWATSSNGTPNAANLPGTNTNVHFDAYSFAYPTDATGTVTVDAIAYCLNMDWTGSTNTPTFAGSSIMYIYGSLTLIAGMGYSHSGLVDLHSSVAGRTVTTAGISITSARFYFNGIGGWTLQDTFTTTGAIYYYAGSLNTNGQTLTCTTFLSDTASAKTLTLGASIINCTAWTMTVLPTLVEGTSSIRVTGIGAFAGGGEQYCEVQLNGTSHTVSGSNTFTNLIRTGTATKTDTVTFTSGTTQTVTGNCTLAGNSATNRLLMQSSTLGTAATLDVDGAWTGTQNVDFMDITSAHAVDLSAITGLSGDCGGNTNITFTSAATQTWGTDAGSWSNVAKWTSRVPLPQDNVVFDATSITGGGQTVTVDMPRIGASINFTGVLNTPTLSLSNIIENYGSLTLVSGLTYMHNSKYNYFRGRASYSFASGGKTLYAISVYAPTGTLTIQDNLTLLLGIYHYNGTLDINDNDISTARFDASGSGTRTLNLGGGTITVTDTAATTKWNLATVTGLTFDAETSTIVMTSTLTNTQTFAGGGLTYNDITIEGNGNYALTISGSNTFNTFTVDRSVAAKTVKFTDGTITTMSNMVCATSGVTVVTLNGTAAAGWNLVKSGGGFISLDYLSISYSAASPANTWFAGTHSTDVVGNSGWIFTAPLPPTVVTNPAYDVEEVVATLSGNITAVGSFPSANITGFVWDTDSGFPYTNNTSTPGTWGVGEFHETRNLVTGELYYYRAYATSLAGTGYGAEALFLLKPYEPTNLAGTPVGVTQINLSWTNGSGADNTTLLAKQNSYSVNRTDGTIIYSNVGTSVNHTGLSNGQDWYYRCWSWCAEGGLEQWSDNYSQFHLYINLGAPTNFTLTQVGVNSVNVSWTKNPFAITTYIRNKTEGYPATVSDGYLAYNGTATTFLDAGLNLDTYEYCYRAWSWANPYSADYAEGSIGGKKMILLAFFLVAVCLSFLSWRGRNLLITLGGVIMWFVMLSYTRINPIAGIAVGSTTDGFIVFLCWAMAIGTGLQYFVSSRRERQLKDRGYTVTDGGGVVGSEKAERKAVGLMDMTPAEYQAYVRTRLRRRRR